MVIIILITEKEPEPVECYFCERPVQFCNCDELYDEYLAEQTARLEEALDCEEEFPFGEFDNGYHWTREFDDENYIYL